MDKGGSVRVIGGKEVRRNVPMKYFFPTGGQKCLISPGRSDSN